MPIDVHDSAGLVRRSYTYQPSLLKVLMTAPSVHTELMDASFCWSANTVGSICRSP